MGYLAETVNILAVVGAIRSRIVPVPPSSRAALLDRFTVEVKNAYFARKARPGWDGCIRYFGADGSFLSGFLPDIVEILEGDGHRVQYHDERKKPERVREIPTKIRAGFELRDYQAEIVQTFLTTTRGTVKAATNSGKTGIAVAITAALGCRTLFVVPGLDLAIQTVGVYRDLLPEARVGLLTGSGSDVRFDETNGVDIVVGNVQGIAAKARQRVQRWNRKLGRKTWQLGAFTPAGRAFLGSFDFLVGDELHLLTSADYGKILDVCPAYFRLGLSATPSMGERSRDLLFVGHFGDVIAEVSQTYLRDTGRSATVRIELLDYAPLEKIKAATWPQQYQEGVVHCTARNAVIVDAVMTRDMTAGRRSMILVERYAQAAEIGQLLHARGVAWHWLSGQNRNERADVLGRFRTEPRSVAVATRVMGTGIDIKEIDSLTIAGGGGAAHTAVQRGGRVVRFYEGKDAVIRLPRDEGVYDERVVPPRKRFLERHYRTTVEALRTEGFRVDQ